MLNVFKMDIRRMLRSKAFFFCIVFMNLITGTMVIFDVVPSFAAVMGNGEGGSMDMMGSMMGIGMAFIIIGILFALHTCGDFSSGFAKNIFTRHANPIRYFGGKLLSLTVTGTIMITVYMLVSALFLAICGSSVALPGGVGGLLLFFIEKIFIIIAFAALILLACLTTRKSVVGVIVAAVVAMGVLPMILSIAGDYLGLSLISDIGKYTISGLSGQANLVFSASVFVTIIIGSLIWTGLCAVLGNRAIKLKDI